MSCELFVSNCRIKQCFNCQRYDHVDKIYRYEKWCFVCFEFHNAFTCKMSMNKRKCVNCEDNHSIWSFQCKIKMIEKDKISNIWRTKSILYSTKFKKMQKATFNQLNVIVQSTLIHNEVTSSTLFSCSFVKEILIQNEIEILNNIMHLKTRNYTINEITNKRTLFQNFDRSMSSSFHQRFVSVVQMINN
jgi:hypothetical protein